MRGELALGKLRRRDFEKQIESLDDKTERHYRNRGAHPSEKGALVGGVVAVALDHGKPRRGGECFGRRAATGVAFIIITQRLTVGVADDVTRGLFLNGPRWGEAAWRQVLRYLPQCLWEMRAIIEMRRLRCFKCLQNIPRHFCRSRVSATVAFKFINNLA